MDFICTSLSILVHNVTITIVQLRRRQNVHKPGGGWNVKAQSIASLQYLITPELLNFLTPEFRVLLMAVTVALGFFCEVFSQGFG